MNRREFFKALVVLTFVTLPFFSFACKSTPEADAEGKVIAEKGVSLSVPVQKKVSSSLSEIDQSIVNDVKIGTRLSLKRAFANLRQSEQEYTESQAVLLNMIYETMQILYPEDKILWLVPTLTEENDYISILDSAKKGVYDDSAAYDDFFVRVLPSLVLITSPNSTGFFADSRTSLDIALSEFPESFIANYLRGVLAYRQQHYSEANVFFQKACEIDPEYINLKRSYAESLLKVGDNERSFAIANALLESDPENFDYLRICAYATLNQKKMAEAQQYIIRALQQQPNNPDFILLRAKMLMSEGEYLNASSLLDAYYRNDNTSKDYLLMRATLQRDWNKNNTTASNTISQALYLYPDDTEVILFAVELMISSGQQIGTKSSRELVEQVIATEPSNMKSQELLLKILVNEKQWQEAYSLSSELIQKGNCSLETVSLRIEICLYLKNNSDARKTIPLLSKLTSDQSFVDLAQIRILISEGNRAEALKQITASLSKDYSNQVKSDLYFEKSRIASSSEAQLADLRSCLTANPRNQNALLALYNYYFDKADYRKSQYYLRQAIALNPQNAELMTLSSQLEELLKTR